VAKDQIELLNEVRNSRDKEKVQVHIDQLRTISKKGGNLVPYLIDAFRDYVSLGEVCQVFKEEYGTFEQPTVI
jgi:methylmalonyl-CoA mutase N-terminal domain/subunit